MVDHGADFINFEGLMNKTINPHMDRFLEEDIGSFRDDQEDSRSMGFFDVEEKILLSDSRGFNV